MRPRSHLRTQRKLPFDVPMISVSSFRQSFKYLIWRQHIDSQSNKTSSLHILAWCCKKRTTDIDNIRLTQVLRIVRPLDMNKTTDR